ncbi:MULTISPECIES: glyoxylate reductase [Pseudothermotoga]|uniref:D-isomer specific 2-hydroxyacid dehydrogenase NAD-binding n=1 Tax=Pseudothermotoga lettingae (strain ATCC BAA-301 / DSM 14385 / NBRC 107922 / TMO) TaxID=416591 RepID=A8F7W7_PSELT|nr:MULTISPECIES: glyoxylate reductase [Pseudothermotoga]ABV34251.1 D-isomer specific 2-hydroxyacid dehydrogenase NAD-binding [Pseudothermotoga lettingae TMO]KUK21300.1 MAG: D-isomer specific 2-hydroxyacid dehydrogenase NAD-binding [Pseudothermotoga lettingae]MDI3494963.1 glyoxylate reductase [Pseudothermotoga sp.]MDK2884857.1 glyoxylate reductase [Pseudothermotoga sp.]GLI48804.1 D-glycerate dehydrogenase [Pseudothermotoga lettingae TMO]
MKKPKVFVTAQIPDEGLKMISQHCEMQIGNYDGVLPKDVLIDKVKGVDGILCLLADVIDKDVMEAAGKQLKVIANYAVGYNNIDIEEATKRGIMVTNTPGVLTETTADLAWALMMSIARRIVESDKFVREGKFNGWQPMLMLGTDIYGATLGVVGFGRIGQAVARRASGFNMRVLYYSRKRAPEDVEKQLNASFVDLSTLLRESDFVTLHLPLTKETYHLIGEEELRMMKKEAYLINTARGPVIDEKALVKALKNKWIRGAALDVFEKEPQIEPELLELDNVILTPHIGSASYTTRTKMSVMAAENLVKALYGEIPPNLVNTEVLKK